MISILFWRSYGSDDLLYHKWVEMDEFTEAEYISLHFSLSTMNAGINYQTLYY